MTTTPIFALLLLCLVAGCAAGTPGMTTTIGQSVLGQDIETTTLGSGPEVVLIVGGIHGSEAAGVPLVRRLVEEAADRPQLLAGRTLVAVAEMNPDGVDADRRYNERGVDLNRNWPAANRRDDSDKSGPAPLSEPESAALAALIDEVRPARILTIHQPLKCVDWDGPAEDLAHKMADACGLPAKQLGGRPGSMGSHLGGERQIPIITLELPRDADDLSDAAKWDEYGEALLVFLEG